MFQTRKRAVRQRCLKIKVVCSDNSSECVKHSVHRHLKASVVYVGRKKDVFSKRVRWPINNTANTVFSQRRGAPIRASGAQRNMRDGGQGVKREDFGQV